MTDLEEQLALRIYREMRRQIRIRPWNAFTRIFFLLLLALALANFVLNILVIVEGGI